MEAERVGQLAVDRPQLGSFGLETFGRRERTRRAIENRPRVQHTDERSHHVLFALFQADGAELHDHDIIEHVDDQARQTIALAVNEPVTRGLSTGSAIRKPYRFAQRDSLLEAHAQERAIDRLATTRREQTHGDGRAR